MHVKFSAVGFSILLFAFMASTAAAQEAAPDAATSLDATAIEPVTGAEAPATGVAEEPPAATAAEPAPPAKDVVWPLVCLGVGIATVLWLIIVLKVNAFLALITAAMIVSLMAPSDIAGDPSGKISRVASAFGGAAGSIGIVIAMAAVIGKCMLDSGAADRIVRAFLRLMGEKGAPMALMGSGFVLAVPVFFDTVFYLLVPLARSLYRTTNRNYLLYIMAIGAGGAITHTLVPPTPGPLLMASNLGFDVGWMILVGILVATPSAIVGVLWAIMIDRTMDVPMRPIGTEPEPKPLTDDQLPSLAMSLLPVLLPVVLIAANTVLNTIADNQHAALLRVDDISDWNEFHRELREQAEGDAPSPGKRMVEFIESGTGRTEQREAVVRLIERPGPLSEGEREELTDGLNAFVLNRKDFHRGGGEDAFVGVLPNATARSLLSQTRLRMSEADVERMNRSLLESAFPTLIKTHHWYTPARQRANWSALLGNANLVLLISTIIALALVVRQRRLTRKETAQLVETSLMSGGVIILITAGGGAFGAMLEKAQIGDAIQTLLGGAGGAESSTLVLLLMAFVFGSLLKIAQGSGTVAMIVGTSMMAAIVGPIELTFHPVYIACAVGAGSLVCSWMNDSGFWIFAKMGGLTEVEALKSWTVMLVVLGCVSFMTTVLLAHVMPLR